MWENVVIIKRAPSNKMTSPKEHFSAKIQLGTTHTNLINPVICWLICWYNIKNTYCADVTFNISDIDLNLEL